MIIKFCYIIAVLALCCNISANAHNTSSITPDSAENYLLNYCYNYMLIQTYGLSIRFPTNIASDETLAGGGIMDGPELPEIDSFLVQPNHNYVESLWNKYYESIKRCNLLLGSIDTASGNDYDRYWSEAKCLRAYFYFCLVRIYGGVPLWISNDTTQLYNIPRASATEVYDQIEKDLSDAITYLPGRTALPAGEEFRVTSGTAQTLLGKAYLYQEKWAQAEEKLMAVLNSGEYNLLPDFSEIWETTNEFTAESIFEIPFTSVADNLTYGNYDVMMMAYRGGTGAGTIYRGGWGLCPVVPDLVEAYLDQDDTVRLDATVVDEETLLADGCNIIIEDSRNYTGYFNNKYASLVADYIHPYYSEKNEIILRLADVLLMCAEALYQLGNEADAQNFLNTVRARLPLESVTDFGEPLLDAIREERRLELALEGERFFDLVRWGLADSVLSDMGYQPHNNIWPIPYRAICLNPNLIQNPEYTGINSHYLTGNNLNLQLAPNPVRDKLDLSFNLHQPGDVQISVYSIEGRKVYGFELFNLPAGSNSYEIDINYIQNGVYSVVLKSRNSKSVAKTVILK